MVKELTQGTKKVRAERVRLIRESLDLSRKALGDKYKKYGLSPGTLASWEEGRWGGLTEKGAEKLVQAFKDEGVQVALDWLLHGVGKSPDWLVQGSGQSLISHKVKLLNNRVEQLATSSITQELKLFYELHSQAVDMIISDDGMAPILQLGDHVAGQKVFEKDIQKTIGLPCIVQTKQGQMYVRLVEIGNSANCYTLICANKNTQIAQPIIENIEVFSAAPIVWIRKPDFVL